MRNFKKIVAVVVALVMLVGVVGISAAADQAPVLTLYGKTETSLTNNEGYYGLAVYLDDAGSAVGGIEGVITYDTEEFEYAGVVLSDNFTGLNTAENSVACDGQGNIKFVGLATGTGEWFVLQFKVIKAGTGTFTLETKAANSTGTDYITVTAVNEETEVKGSDIIKVEGAAIKKVENPEAQDIKFNITVDNTLFPAEEKVVEVGVLMMFTRRLGYRELTLDLEDTTGLVKASKLTDTAAGFTANLNNMTVDALGVKISARAYIKCESGTVYYSNNYNMEFETNSGYASKSVIDVAREAALDCTGADETTVANIATILGKDSIKGDDRTALLSYINEYYNPAA